ncbi:Hsp20/alpha crystallin family protein [Bacillus massiliglaciei]|uniref:Hsp20/alpha crystallin family protein n=1 Tax=Bacillus massiliglaciei TaxID=1816693 RepID=UPI000DA63AA1|nr:Hsp20/alpha crystallin family protein [Bacillus massiliglaciei]
MSKSNPVSKSETKKFNEWVKNYFLDPNIAMLDNQLFFIDIYEDNEEYTVEAILEHVELEDISIQLDENEISIFIKKEKQNNQPSVSRSIPFPFPIATHKIKAEFRHSLLTIHIFKHETASNTQRIQIE